MKTRITESIIEDATASDVVAAMEDYYSRSCSHHPSNSYLTDDVLNMDENFEYLEAFCVFGISTENKYQRRYYAEIVDNTEEPMTEVWEENKQAIRNWSLPHLCNRGIGYTMTISKCGECFTIRQWVYRWGANAD